MTSSDKRENSRLSRSSTRGSSRLSRSSKRGSNHSQSGSNTGRVRFRSQVEVGYVSLSQVAQESRKCYWGVAPEDDHVWDGENMCFREEELSKEELCDLLKKRYSRRRSLKRLFKKPPDYTKIADTILEEGTYHEDDDDFFYEREYSAPELSPAGNLPPPEKSILRKKSNHVGDSLTSKQRQALSQLKSRRKKAPVKRDSIALKRYRESHKGRSLKKLALEDFYIIAIAVLIGLALGVSAFGFVRVQDPNMKLVYQLLAVLFMVSSGLLITSIPKEMQEEYPVAQAITTVAAELLET